MTHDISQYCKAGIFSKVGKQTPVGVRFSTVVGESGSADTARDPRGFAVKFYTEEGNWDLVGNNTPIFFIRSVSQTNIIVVNSVKTTLPGIQFSSRVLSTPRRETPKLTSKILTPSGTSSL